MTEQQSKLISSNIGVFILALCYFLLEHVFNDNDERVKRVEANQIEILAQEKADDVKFTQIIKRLDEATSDRYTSTMAKVDNTNFQRQLDELSRRIQAIEESVEQRD